MHSWNQTTGTVYLTSGLGYGTTPLAAFDAAEVHAKIMATNAIRVTSFVPPGWQTSRDQQALAEKSGRGAFLPMAYEYAVSDTEEVAAALVIGVNSNPADASIVMEHAKTGVHHTDLLQLARESVDEVFGFRSWKTKELIEISLGGQPKDGLYVCALVAALYFPNGE